MALVGVLRTQRNNFSKLFYNSRNAHNRPCHQEHGAEQKSAKYTPVEKKKIKLFLLHKSVEYLKDYSKVIERRFPRVVQIYRVFMHGTNEFLSDLKEFYKIVRILNAKNRNFKYLTRREIELYHQMPKDLSKVAPVLFVSVLPFAYYFILPLIYYFPRQLLSSHFWNIQQKAEFSRYYLQARLLHNKPVFRHLQSQLPYLCGHELYEHWNYILAMLGSGQRPSTDNILRCKELFSSEPYHLLFLSGNHVKHLLILHNMHTLWYKRRMRLAKRAIILHEMDKAICREGGVHNMPHNDLRRACYIRGLNPLNMKNEDMVTWLNDWVTISREVDKSSLSLLLHCPVLLGYNEPSNWILIYSKK